MEQPKFPNLSPQQVQQLPQQPPPSKPKNNSSKEKIKFPTPQELITHYETQGMNTQEASIKVIDDLQHMLFRIVTSKTDKKDKFMSEASRKLDIVNARLAIVDKKLDSKPGYPAGFVIGVGSATAFRGIAAVWPQVANAVVGVWNSVRSSTKT